MTSHMATGIRVLSLGLAVIAAPAARGQSELRETALTVGDGWGTVRELRQMNLVRGEQVALLDRIPREADLASLVLRSRRVDLELISWERPEDQPDLVRCVIRSPIAAARVGVDVIYRLDGLRWTAHYEILVRGEREDEREPVSADLRGIVRIVNTTARTFSNAVVRLVHLEDAAPREPSHGPGFLMLDRSNPLSDLWFDAPVESPIPYSYEAPRRIHVRAYSETEAPLVNRVRVPARRFYSMRAEDFPVDAREYLPLTRLIAFRHESDRHAPVSMLPPGAVRIYMGALRRHFVQEARFRRTSPGEEIQADLGPSEDVMGRRSAGLREALPGRVRSESYRIQIRNERDTDIQLEIDEKPPVTLGWMLTSSTLSCRQVSKRLQFFTSLAAGEEGLVEYQLRVMEPEI